jgi:hypothetical protein
MLVFSFAAEAGRSRETLANKKVETSERSGVLDASERELHDGQYLVQR